MQELLAQLLLVLRGAWRYRWPALALTWVLALAGWIIVATIPDQFEARTRVYVDTADAAEAAARRHCGQS